MLTTIRLSLHDNLEEVAAAINQAQWDELNDISSYSKEGLAHYFERSKDAIFLVCYLDAELAGIASGIVLQKPYGNEQWLYVDEIDVAVPHRRKGVGKALMQEFLAIANEHGCSELWLGADKVNVDSNAFYKSLNPTEIEEFIGYAFKL